MTQSTADSALIVSQGSIVTNTPVAAPNGAGSAEKYDKLTGLLSLAFFTSLLHAGRGGLVHGPASLIYLNVPNFKAYNKTYGFLNGDEFLKSFANAIAREFPDDDVARESADRFIVYLKRVDSKAIRRSVSKIAETVEQYASGMKLSVKAGVRCLASGSIDPTMFVEQAKSACEYITDRDDTQVLFHSVELEREIDFQHYIITGFEDALAKGYIQPFYQREIRTLTGQSCGYEALARWVDADYGMISPVVFVPVLERAKLIHLLDIHIIRQVCADIRTVLDRGQSAQPVSVNLSRLDFQLTDMFMEIERCRTEFNIEPSYLNIEITESAVAGVLSKEIKRFRDAGYQVWMDDFGSGYSSLNNLKDHEFDVIKIDMAFLRQMQANPKAKVILAAVVGMAKDLGIHTLAEGVETVEQFEFLRSVGCERIQGYLFGKPMPFDRKNDASMSFVGEDSSVVHPLIENTGLRSYFEKIGEVNVLGSAPLESRQLEVTHGIPTGIIEIEGRSVRFLYVNDACKAFIGSLGVHNVQEAERLFAALSRLRIIDLVIQTAERSEKSGRAESFEGLINGVLCTISLRFIVRNGERVACVMVPKNITGSLATRQDEDTDKLLLYVLRLFFRIDLFNLNDGTVKNIYLTAKQERITDYKEISREAVRHYAEHYIAEKDRERFRMYYDMSTVESRLLESHGATLVEYFYSAGEIPVLQKYYLVPFQVGENFKILSCCMELGTSKELALFIDAGEVQIAKAIASSAAQ